MVRGPFGGAAFIAAAVLAGCARAGSCETDRVAFEPILAEKVHVSGGETTLVVSSWRDFATSQKAEFCTGNFSKEGRTVTNVLIVLTPRTFFQADNFRNAETLELQAYSHEPKISWALRWRALVIATAQAVGPENIVATSPTTEAAGPQPR